MPPNGYNLDDIQSSTFLGHGYSEADRQANLQGHSNTAEYSRFAGPVFGPSHGDHRNHVNNDFHSTSNGDVLINSVFNNRHNVKTSIDGILPTVDGLMTNLTSSNFANMFAHLSANPSTVGGKINTGNSYLGHFIGSSPNLEIGNDQHRHHVTMSSPIHAKESNVSTTFSSNMERESTSPTKNNSSYSEIGKSEEPIGSPSSCSKGTTKIYPWMKRIHVSHSE